MENIQFNIGNLDLSSIKDADLNPPKFLRQEGVFNFEVVNCEVSPKKKDGTAWSNLVDANGSEFQPFQVTLQTTIDGEAYNIKDVMYMPISGNGWYQKEGGKPTLVFAQQTRAFLQSLTKEEINISSLMDYIKSAGSLLSAGGSVIAKVGKKSKEEVVRESDTCFKVKLADGSLLENDEGEIAEADSYKGIMELYKEIKGTPFKSGVEIKAYYLPKTDA